jgi:hypothetical protein
LIIFGMLENVEPKSCHIRRADSRIWRPNWEVSCNQFGNAIRGREWQRSGFCEHIFQHEQNIAIIECPSSWSWSIPGDGKSQSVLIIIFQNLILNFNCLQQCHVISHTHLLIGHKFASPIFNPLMCVLLDLADAFANLMEVHAAHQAAIEATTFAFNT